MPCDFAGVKGHHVQARLHPSALCSASRPDGPAVHWQAAWAAPLPYRGAERDEAPVNWAAAVRKRIASWLTRSWIDPKAVRAEAWALGGRHQGRVVEGARLEMRAPGLPARRVGLLRAVVRAERAKAGDG